MIGMTILVVSLILALFGAGIRIVRPTEKGVIERLGKYKNTAEQGFSWIIPIIDRMRRRNITEQMVDVPEQTIQTKDKLNTVVDAMVYYQVHDVKASYYNVDNHRMQLASLARTTLRAVMGGLTLTECIQERSRINTDVENVLSKETKSYGVSVLRVEVQRIEPPEDVQEAMNEVVKASNEKLAAVDRAEAVETVADGERKASIKRAEGKAKSITLEATAVAEKIKVVNESANKFFVNNAVELKKLEVTQASLETNSKIILTEKGISPILVINEDGNKSPSSKKVLVIQDKNKE